MANAARPMATPAPLAHRMVGGEFDFIVAEGNSFTRIGSRFGESPKVLARDNGKEVTDHEHRGEYEQDRGGDEDILLAPGRPGFSSVIRRFAKVGLFTVACAASAVTETVSVSWPTSRTTGIVAGVLMSS